MKKNKMQKEEIKLSEIKDREAEQTKKDSLYLLAEEE